MEDNVRRRAGCSEMGDGLEPVGTCIFAGQYRNHAGHSARRGCVDAANKCMRMWGPQRGGISLSRKIEVVTVTTVAGKQAQVLLATYRVPYDYLHGLSVRE